MVKRLCFIKQIFAASYIKYLPGVVATLPPQRQTFYTHFKFTFEQCRQ